MNLNGLAAANGLEEKDRPLVRELIEVLNTNYSKHEKRGKYYDDKVRVKNLGIRTPKDAKNIKTKTGWAAKAVDGLAVRSSIDSIWIDGDRKNLDRILNFNKFFDSYQMALPSMLIHGCGFWSVTKQDNDVVINYRDAMTASAIWDWKHKRIKAGLIVDAFRQFGRYKTKIPSHVTVHTSDSFIIFDREDRKSWKCEYKENIMGRPCMEPMVWKQRIDRPFGRSRISPACMRIIDSMQREIVRFEYHSEFYSSPQKYLFGLDDEQFEALKENKLALKMNDFLMGTRDPETGQTPSIGVLQEQSMEPHIAVMDKLAYQMASETSLPASSFAVVGKSYTSSDALRATNDDIIIVAKHMNEHNGEAIKTVLQMALAISDGIKYSELTPENNSLTVRWCDEDMQSASQVADAVVKIASAVPGFSATEAFWGKLRFSEEERKHIVSEIKAKESADTLKAILGSSNEDRQADSRDIRKLSE